MNFFTQKNDKQKVMPNTNTPEQSAIPEELRIWYIGQSHKELTSNAYKEWIRRGQKLCYEVAYSEGYEDASEAVYRKLTERREYIDLLKIVPGITVEAIMQIVQMNDTQLRDYEKALFAAEQKIKASQPIPSLGWVDVEDDLPFDQNEEYVVRWRMPDGWDKTTAFYDNDAKQFYTIDHGSNIEYMSVREFKGLQWLKEEESLLPVQHYCEDHFRHYLNQCPDCAREDGAIQPSIEPDAPINDGWKSVEKELPEVGEYIAVLLNAYEDDEPTWLKGRRLHDGWSAFYADGEHSLQDEWRPVTHWMPIPKSPINVTK